MKVAISDKKFLGLLKKWIKTDPHSAFAEFCAVFAKQAAKFSDTEDFLDTVEEGTDLIEKYLEEADTESLPAQRVKEILAAGGRVEGPDSMRRYYVFDNSGEYISFAYPKAVISKPITL